MSKNVYSFIDIARRDPNKQSIKLRKSSFVEIYQAVDDEQAKQQASRCLSCGNPYCEWRCPLHNYIPNWLKLIQDGSIIAAAELSYQTNSLPEVCGRVCPQERLCEAACTLHDQFGAVTIGSLECYITDKALAMGWRPTRATAIYPQRSVAIIGAGPAGLACADRLIRQGISVIVYDKYPEIGGLLTFGIPAFKLDKQIIINRRQWLEEMGVKFQLNTEVGQDIDLATLQANHHAIFIAVGAYQPVNANLTNQSAAGVFNALPFLIANNQHLLGYPADKKYLDFTQLKVLVLGGGDTAMDCVRTALRLNAAQVICAYRRDELAMPGSKREVQNAKEEGAEFLFNRQPIRIEVNAQGQAIGVSFVKTSLIVNPQDKSSHLIADPNSHHVIGAEVIILAFGFQTQSLYWLHSSKVKFNQHGMIITAGGNQLKQQTHQPNIFAGGDITHGSDLVVTAIADGRTAAQNILSYFQQDQALFDEP